MRKQRPKMSEEEHVVLQFRPRGRAGLPRHRPPANAADTRSPDKADHPSPRRPSRDQPDDFSHRMLANAAAMAFTIALISVTRSFPSSSSSSPSMVHPAGVVTMSLSKAGCAFSSSTIRAAPSIV